MRVSILVIVSAHLLALSSASAAKVEFPYEAVVQSDGVIVRSGPGEAYHPTSKLSAGQRLTVHRHDPGGWFVIDPPPGSFSWIDARFVETTSDGRGVVQVPGRGSNIPPRVEVWVGSQFTNERRFVGRQLATGDEVTILGEMVHETETGPTTFYKIKPPRIELRWVKGDFVLPASPVAKTQPDLLTSESVEVPREAVDSFGGPSLLTESRQAPPGFDSESDMSVHHRSRDSGIDDHRTNEFSPPSGHYERDRSQLRQLDEQLDAMFAGGPGQWRLDEIEQAYRTLQAAADSGVAGMIEARLAAIEARRPIQAEYDAFLEITTRTDRRDAELLALQNPGGTGVPAIPVSARSVALADAQQIPSQPRPPGSRLSYDEYGAGGHPSFEAGLDRLDGAGIISRAPQMLPGVPPHVLVAPDGRPLAYLHAEPGINLDAHLGQAVGLVGRRAHEPRLGSDVIHVMRLTPVRLQR